MRILLSNILLLTKRLMVLMVCLTLCRAYFLLCNLGSFSPLDAESVLVSFAAGLCFDFSSLFFVNVWFYALFFLPCRFVENRTYQEVLRQAMILANMLAVLLNVIDTGYFSFQNGRSDADFVMNMLFSHDTAAMLPQYAADYWYHGLFFVAMYALLEVWLPRYKPCPLAFKAERLWATAAASVLAAAVYSAASFALYRGSGRKPRRRSMPCGLRGRNMRRWS